MFIPWQGTELARDQEIHKKELRERNNKGDEENIKDKENIDKEEIGQVGEQTEENEYVAAKSLKTALSLTSPVLYPPCFRNF
jgi:hypothetical protein